MCIICGCHKNPICIIGWILTHLAGIYGLWFHSKTWIIIAVVIAILTYVLGSGKKEKKSETPQAPVEPTPPTEPTSI